MNKQQADDLAEITAAMQRWFQSQEIEPNRALLAMLVTIGRILGSSAPDWPNMLENVTRMQSDLAKYSCEFFQQKRKGRSLPQGGGRYRSRGDPPHRHHGQAPTPASGPSRGGGRA
jgi:hypothetical protein